MTNPHNRYRSAGAPPPVPMGGGSPSLAQTLGPLALKYGINAAVPGGGLAAEAAGALGNAYLFNNGGMAPGYNPAQDPTRKIGDAIAASGGAQLLEEGGRAKGTNRGGATADALRKLFGYAWENDNLAEKKGRWAGMNKFPTHKESAAEYKEMGGVIGPLSKTVLKDKDGSMSERHYHSPLAAKPKEGE